RRNGPVHRCGLDRDLVASHLREGPQRARLLGVHRQRSATRRRHALSLPQQISLARHADALSVHRGGRERGRCGRDGDEDREIHHRAVAGAGVIKGRALIIGGSLGGMFAAHLLRQAGWRVDVFERSAEDLAGRGAGLGSHAALVAILKRIGIDFSAPLGVSIPRYVWLDRDGGVVADVPRPRMMTAWSRLYRPLKDLLPRELYHPAKSLLRVEQDAASVTAIFADGTRESGDLLIGA